MPIVSNTNCRPAAGIGEYISHDQFEYLTDEYARQHPTEQKQVFIASEHIRAALDSSSHSAGLRFMYGQKESALPGSRSILLLPYSDRATDSALPRLILSGKGYFTDAGNQVPAQTCWEMMGRYVQRMSDLVPEGSVKEIPRSCFYGINILKALLAERSCAGINYYFGYNPAVPSLSLRYPVVLEAVDIRRQSLGIFVDNGQMCPPSCNPPGFGF